ncbi:MAG: hypothetical protein GF405_06020 [Candidatus Eisenbacteria bacterium]|nr:hypothetical protein [Candidatus Eisenbacteria bacterium]
MTLRLTAAVLLLALALAGCGYYSFSPTLQKGGIGSVALPVLENETLEYGIETEVTDVLNDVLTEGGLRVVGEDEADALLRGAVTLYERSVMSYDAGGDPREYKVRILADLAYEDVSSRETIWEGTAEGWAVYSTGGDSEFTSEEEARENAIEKLADDVLSKTVQGW